MLANFLSDGGDDRARVPTVLVFHCVVSVWKRRFLSCQVQVCITGPEKLAASVGTNHSKERPSSGLFLLLVYQNEVKNGKRLHFALFLEWSQLHC